MRRRILSKLRVVNNLPRDTRGAHVANALSVDASIRVSKVYAKRVLGDATGLTKSAFRKAFTELPCLIDYLNSEGKCRAFVRWTDGTGRGLNVVNDNIRYFAEYGICAKGIRDFVASVGVPFFSFDACHAKHIGGGGYSNAVSLVDTKAKSLTNYEIALTTDPESEQESLYASLFKEMERDENESELINL